MMRPILILATLLVWPLSGIRAEASASSCSFPALYNFGDSNSDTGGISAAFEAIQAPYGQAFLHRPSGRDSDGRLIVDYIGKKEKSP